MGNLSGIGLEEPFSTLSRKSVYRTIVCVPVLFLVVALLTFCFAPLPVNPLKRMAYGYWRFVHEADQVVEVPCEILRWEVLSRGGDKPASWLEVEYQYTFQGRVYVGDSYALGWLHSAPLELNDKRPAHGEALCYVHPDCADAAMLDPAHDIAGGFVMAAFHFLLLTLGVMLILVFLLPLPLSLGAWVGKQWPGC